MAIVRGKIQSLQELKQLLTNVLVPSVFASVEFGPINQVMCLDADRNITMEFCDRPDGSSTPGYYRIYRSKNDFFELTKCNIAIGSGDSAMNYIGCENGIIFTGGMVGDNGYYAYGQFMITKTNNDQPAFIATPFRQGGVDYSASLYHIAYGDNPSFNTLTPVTHEVGTQTVLQVFATNANIGVKSVTPKAFMIVRDTAYALNFGVFTLDGVEYITNGYLAISTATD
jgi:hypothetical protein